MKIPLSFRPWNPWLGSVSIALAFGIVLWACLRATSQTAPALRATFYSSNQIQIVVTNAVPGVTYEIQRRLLLGDTNYPWRTHLVGTNTQTNFIADMGIDPLGWFIALPCTDCDGDGVPNWADPQPANAAVSNLVVTIDTPSNGSTVP